jgi:peroxiredoxin
VGTDGVVDLSCVERPLVVVCFPGSPGLRGESVELLRGFEAHAIELAARGVHVYGLSILPVEELRALRVSERVGLDLLSDEHGRFAWELGLSMNPDESGEPEHEWMALHLRAGVLEAVFFCDGPLRLMARDVHAALVADKGVAQVEG